MIVDSILKKGNEEEKAKLAKEIRYNYGCHVNHELYWENLAPPKL